MEDIQGSFAAENGLARRWYILLSLVLVVLVLDQATKFWAVGRLTRAFELHEADGVFAQIAVFFDAEKLEKLRAPSVVVHRDFWHFKYVENPGAAWGMLGRLPDGLRIPFFWGVSLVAMTLIFAFFRRLSENARLLQVALSLVLGGALGNFVDRVARGYVIDFIDWHWRNQPHLHWPTFNVADVGICVGVSLLLVQSLFGRHPLGEPEGEGSVVPQGSDGEQNATS